MPDSLACGLQMRLVVVCVQIAKPLHVHVIATVGV